MPCYLRKLITFERLEPYEVKVSSTILRRGRRSNPSFLSDGSQARRNARRAWQLRNISGNKGNKMRVITLIFSILIFYSVLNGVEKTKKENIFKMEMNNQNNLNKFLDANQFKIKTIDLNEGENSDFHFLKNFIGNSEIVLLGEQDHGDGTSFIAKAKIIKYLHEEMGFNVLAYESDFYDCNIKGNQFKEKKISIAELKKSLWSFWSSGKEIQPFYKYLEYQNNSVNPLHITGFDCQYTNGKKEKKFVDDYLEFIKNFVFPDKVNSNVQENFLKIVKEFFSKPYEYKFSNEFKTTFFDIIDNIINIEKSDTSSIDDFFIQEMKNLKGFAEYKWCSENNKHISRDAQMADNFKWLFEHKFKGEKIIIWAHNFHTLKNCSYIFSNEVIAECEAEGINLNWIGHLMGEILYREYTDKIYSIGFIAYNGEYNNKAFLGNFTNTEKIYSEVNSLEEVIHLRKIDYGFLNLKNTQISEFLMSGDCHNEATKSDWKNVYDGLFYIDKMTGIK